MERLSFSIPEILSIIGLVQCVYLVVYIAIRAKQISHAGLPVLYFLCLGFAFFLDFGAGHIGKIFSHYPHWQWAAWFFGPPLSVLLVLQFSQVKEGPTIRDLWVLALIPICYLLSGLAVDQTPACSGFNPCKEMQAFLNVTGLMAGAISLLLIFSKKDLFKNLLRQRNGKERYWLILSLIFMNIFFLCSMLAGLGEFVSQTQAVMLRTITGLGFVYLVSTSLLRLYPKSAKTSSGGFYSNGELTEEDMETARKIENLLSYEKVYHEPAYSRLDLARECDSSEAVISRIINLHFKKSFPQLMNEHRIEDAKRLLEQTKAPVRVVAEEVGFNSLPTFNRVFREITGESPSTFRKLLKT